MQTTEEINRSIEESYRFGIQQAEEKFAEERMLQRRDSRHPRPLTYLASPYSHPDGFIRLRRYEVNIHATAWLIRTFGWNVFSPIVHSHPLAVIAGLNGDWDFWRTIDEGFLQVSERIVVLRLPGWQESVGVTAELEISAGLSLPVHYLDPEDNNQFTICGVV